MCQFISNVEVGDKIYFLTYEQVYNTPRGDVLRVFDECEYDYIGHGAIRFYYDLEQDEGENKEYADFSSPANFPDVVVRAIKRGDFKGFEFPPQGLLNKPLDDKYKSDRKLLDDKYQSDYGLLWDKYDSDYTLLDDKYGSDCKLLDDKYQSDHKLLWDIYKSGCELLWDKYWDLFAVVENRNEAWKYGTESTQYAQAIVDECQRLLDKEPVYCS